MFRLVCAKELGIRLVVPDREYPFRTDLCGRRTDLSYKATVWVTRDLGYESLCQTLGIDR